MSYGLKTSKSPIFLVKILKSQKPDQQNNIHFEKRNFQFTKEKSHRFDLSKIPFFANTSTPTQ